MKDIWRKKFSLTKSVRTETPLCAYTHHRRPFRIYFAKCLVVRKIVHTFATHKEPRSCVCRPKGEKGIRCESGTIPVAVYLYSIWSLACCILCHWRKLGRRNKRDKSEDLPLQTDFRPRRITGRESEPIFSVADSVFRKEQGRGLFAVGRWCTTCRAWDSEQKERF